MTFEPGIGLVGLWGLLVGQGCGSQNGQPFYPILNLFDFDQNLIFCLYLLFLIKQINMFSSYYT